MPAAAHPETLHPQIVRFAQECATTLNPELAAPIIGCNRNTVVRLCRNGGIEAQQLGRARGTAGNVRWSITRPALIAYLIRSTSGPREAIMHSIQVLCPHWLQFAQHIAAGLPLHTAEEALQAKPRPRPARVSSNVLPFEHPDLFRDAKAS